MPGNLEPCAGQRIAAFGSSKSKTRFVYSPSSYAADVFADGVRGTPVRDGRGIAPPSARQRGERNVIRNLSQQLELGIV